MTFAEKLSRWLQQERHFGEKAKERGKRFTYREIAEATRSDVGYMWRVCSGSIHSPALDTLSKLAEFFGVPLWLMIKEVDEMERADV